MTEPRISFESQFDEESATKNEGLKLDASRSRFTKNKEVKKEFQQQATEVHQRLEGHLREAYELGLEFTNLIADTRVSENIGPYDRSFEKENIRKLIQYAITVNIDPQEQEGMGSVSCIILLLKTMFKMRDRINEMSYDMHKLERRINALEKLVMSSKANSTHEDK